MRSHNLQLCARVCVCASVWGVCVRVCGVCVCACVFQFVAWPSNQPEGVHKSRDQLALPQKLTHWPNILYLVSRILCRVSAYAQSSWGCKEKRCGRWRREGESGEQCSQVSPPVTNRTVSAVGRWVREVRQPHSWPACESSVALKTFKCSCKTWHALWI